jgi:DNA-binding MarR family transcriptional regulator
MCGTGRSPVMEHELKGVDVGSRAVEGSGEADSGTPGGSEPMSQQQLATWRRLLDTTAALSRALSAELVAESGLSSADYQVLLALIDAPGGRLRSSLLADQIDWERSRLSHHLRRMQARHLIDRETDPDDSRATDVVLTREGRDCFLAASRAHTGTVKRYFADALSDEQFSSLEQILLRLQAHVRNM